MTDQLDIVKKYRLQRADGTFFDTLLRKNSIN